MLRKNPRSLRNAAARAVHKGKHGKALRAYLELEDLEPAEGEWPRRAAQMYQRLGSKKDAACALERAVVKYSQAGFHSKADAVRALIARIDPAYAATQKKLLDRYAPPPPEPTKRRLAAGTERIKSPPAGGKLAWAYRPEISKSERVTLALSSLEPQSAEPAPGASEPTELAPEATGSADRRRR